MLQSTAAWLTPCAAQEARRRTLTVHTDVRRVTDAVGIDATDTVTVLLVDARGRLRWRTTQSVSEHSGSELAAAIAADAYRDAGAAESSSIGNVRDVCRTGPYHLYKAIGPLGRSSTAFSPSAQRRKVVSACCCANPYRASLPSARFGTPDHSHPRLARTVRRVGAPTRRSRVNGHRRRVVVAGSTGYIGRRLVADLVAGGHHVRCLARIPDKLDAEPWRAEVEVVAGDVLDGESLAAAFRETDAAYYLVHSIGSQPDWQTRDRTAAENFRDAAAAADLEQIVYLGGLGDDAGGTLSPHLASRHEVGRILATGRVPLTELRAAVVIGSGSASFEMLRHLVEVLPVMTTPRWVETRVQPIAVRDVLAYLTGVLGNADAYGRVFEIGGADVVTYHEMMDMYGQAAGLRRRVILPVPVLSPRLSSLWVGLVTPIPAELARPLIDSLVNEVVVHDHAIDDVVPREPIGCREAIELALRRIGEVEVSTRWTDAEMYGRTPADPMPTDPEWAGATMLTDRQVVHTNATPDALFGEVCALGGDRGWLVGNSLWVLRGWLDRTVGGVGMRRGRRHPTDLRVGDVVDFWRVEAIEPARLLRLRAEMRLPGDAWLEWSIAPEPDRKGTLFVQRALFRPRGLLGRAVLVCRLAISQVHLRATRRSDRRARGTRGPSGSARRACLVALQLHAL